ncbi:MAG: nuclear transport factor 2 family protein [Pseudomonadota bacterium]
MARWKRKELEAAFDKFQAAALKGAQTGDWKDWANCFTRDATYFEHQYGKFWGRDTIHAWIEKTMKPYPVCHMTAFPIKWYTVDAEKGWIICEVLNRMDDLGDGEIYEEPNITILHYGGNGQFKYEEDVYDRKRMGNMVMRWLAAKEAIESAEKKED